MAMMALIGVRTPRVPSVDGESYYNVLWVQEALHDVQDRRLSNSLLLALSGEWSVASRQKVAPSTTRNKPRVAVALQDAQAYRGVGISDPIRPTRSLFM